MLWLFMQMRGLPVLLKNSSLADFTRPCFRVGPSSSLLELDAFLSCFPEKDLGSNSHLLDAWPWAKEGPLSFSRHLSWGLRTPCELVTWQCFPRQETETRDFTRWPVDRAFKNTVRITVRMLFFPRFSSLSQRRPEAIPVWF